MYWSRWDSQKLRRMKILWGMCYILLTAKYCQRYASLFLKEKSCPWSWCVRLSKGRFVLSPLILCLALVSTIIFLLFCFKWGEICKQQEKHKHRIYMCPVKGKLKPNEFKADIKHFAQQTKLKVNAVSQFPQPGFQMLSSELIHWSSQRKRDVYYYLNGPLVLPFFL